MTTETDTRITRVEHGLATLEARLDSRFESLARQVNGLSERLDTAIEWNQEHSNNHHSRGSTIRQGGLTAAAVTILVAAIELFQRFV